MYCRWNNSCSLFIFEAIEHDPRKATSQRDLPLNRTAVPETEFGFTEPAKVRPGKVTLKQAMEIMSFHQEDPATYGPALLAEMYHCREADMDALLRHFRLFTLYLPKTKKSDEKTMSYSQVSVSNDSDDLVN